HVSLQPRHHLLLRQRPEELRPLGAGGDGGLEHLGLGSEPVSRGGGGGGGGEPGGQSVPGQRDQPGGAAVQRGSAYATSTGQTRANDAVRLAAWSRCLLLASLACPYA